MNEVSKWILGIVIGIAGLIFWIHSSLPEKKLYLVTIYFCDNREPIAIKEWCRYQPNSGSIDTYKQAVPTLWGRYVNVCDVKACIASK